MDKDILEIKKRLDKFGDKLDYTDAKITELINIFKQAKLKDLLGCPQQVANLEKRVKELEDRICEWQTSTMQ